MARWPVTITERHYAKGDAGSAAADGWLHRRVVGGQRSAGAQSGVDDLESTMLYAKPNRSQAVREKLKAMSLFVAW